MRFLRISLFIAAALFVAGFAGLLALPKILARQINHSLQSLPGYGGSVETAHLEWKGPRLILRRLEFHKLEETPPATSFSAEQIRIDFRWSQVLRGEAALDMVLEKPRFALLLRQRNIGDPRPTGVWKIYFKGLPPFRIDRLTIHDATLDFRNDQSLPPLDVFLNEFELTAGNVANREAMFLPGTTDVEGRGLLLNHAPVTMSARVEALQKPPVFWLKCEVKGFDLTFLNGLLSRFGGFKLEGGRLDMQTELNARSGEFAGQVHRRLDKLDIKNQDRGFIKDAKDVILQTWIDWHVDASGGIENRFRMSGPLGYMDEDPLLAVVWAGKQAFIQSLKANLPEDLRLDKPEILQDQWAARQAIERKRVRSIPVTQ